MKLRIGFASLLAYTIVISLIGNVSAVSDIGKNSFGFYKDLGSSPEGYVKVELDPDIYSRTTLTPSLSDIRIFDEQDNEVPYYLLSGEEGNKAVRQTIRIMNESVLGNDLFFTIDRQSERNVINKVDVNIVNDKDYLYRVNLQGSENGTIWYDIAAFGYLYNLSDKVSEKKKSITFANNNYRYLKFKLTPEMGTVTTGIINGIDVYFIKDAASKGNKLQSVITENKLVDKKSRIVIDTAYNYNAFNKIRFVSSDVNFNRKVEIYGSHNGIDWAQITGDGQKEIYVYKIGSADVDNSTVEFTRSRYRFILAEIQNSDSPPLKLSDVEIYNTPEYLIFNSSPQHKYSIYFGNSTIKRPEYDIRNFVSLLDFDSLNVVTAGKLLENTQFTGEQKPLSERYGWLIWVVILVMVLALGYLIIKNLKKLNNG